MGRSIIKDGQFDFYGEVSWANFLDWIIVFCLGAILSLTALQLGGVMPETQLLLQPLYVALLFFHGLWVVVNKEHPGKLSLIPIMLVPFLVWVAASIILWSPTPWRGSYELSHYLSAFFFFWVAVNNVRNRSHLIVLLFFALAPVLAAIFIGYYQFFQKPEFIASAKLSYPVELNARYIGQATGIFADQGSLAAFMAFLLPCFLVMAFVRRMPVILRVFSSYIALLLIVGVTFTQIYWVLSLVFLAVVLVPWFCFKERASCYKLALLGLSIVLLVILGMHTFNPAFKRGLEQSMAADGEGVRLVVWQEALNIFSQNPVIGSGAGSFAYEVEHSDDFVFSLSPRSPHNSYLLILSSLGLVGASLLFLPLIYVVYRSLRYWREQPFGKEVRGRKRMPERKFLLSVALCGLLIFAGAAVFHFVSYVPALILYGALIFSIAVKMTFHPAIKLPEFRYSGLCYCLILGTLGATYWAHFSFVVESEGLESQASQRLEALAERGVSVSGRADLLDKVVALYEDALIANPENADAWIGLSMANCQMHYRDPSNFKNTGAVAMAAASRAYKICPGYWLASSQLGVAYALLGEKDKAHAALARAIKLAPNSSNAHYYYASFISHEDAFREKAAKHVNRALEINPENASARRLEQKLLIL